jgi:prephenate dehydrogenase
MINSVGIIGYGNFGAFLHILVNRFAPDINVSVYSPDKLPDGRLFRSLKSTLQCDVIFLAVPISAYEKTLLEIKSELPPQAILVDIATVKVHTTAAIRKVLPYVAYLSIHPMFGPSSYSKKGGDVSGFRIAVTDTNLEQEKLQALKQWVSDLGFVIVELTAEEHDKKIAETLFLTHYIGQILARGDFARTDIDTASFGYLMDAVDSVRHDAALFADVSQFNPYCKETVERFDQCEMAVKAHYLSDSANRD